VGGIVGVAFSVAVFAGVSWVNPRRHRRVLGDRSVGVGVRGVAGVDLSGVRFRSGVLVGVRVAYLLESRR